MSFDAHANFAYGTIDVAPTPAASGLSLNVATGVGALFPSAPFNAVVYPNGSPPLASNAEIIRVTSKGSGDDWTIVRTQEGTSARTILSGDQIAAAITVKTLTDVETAIPSIAGLISAINVSAGATSQNLSALTFDNSNGVSFGLTGSVVTATVATNYQSQGAYLTTAALSQDSSKYAGTNGAITGGSITVNTDGVSVDLPAYLTTAMASNRGSDFVQATAVFHGTNASGTIASGAISVSVSAPGAANFNISAGTTSNNLTKLTFADGNGVSFGLNASTITATVKTDYLTTAMASNRGTDFVQATANFAGTNASGTIASDGISVSVNPSPAQSNQTVGLYVSSNTYLTSSGTVDARSLTFRGDKSITVGVSAGEVLFSVGAYLTTAALSQDSSKYAGTNGAITGGSITVNTSGVSVNLPAYLTTAALSGDTSKYVQAWELTGNTAGTTSSAQGTKLYFSGGNSLTISGSSNSLVFSVGNYLTTAALSQDSSKYAGTGFTSAGANIGLSGTHNTAGLSLSATVAAQSNQSAIKAFGVSNTGQTAGNTGVSTGIDWVLAGSQSITLSQSTAVGGPNTVWMQHPAWLTTADLSANSSKYVQEWALTGNTAGTTSSAQGTRLYFSGGNSLTISGSSNSLVFSVGNYLTTARASTDAIGLNTAKTNVTWTVNSSGLSLDAGGYAGTGTSATNASITLNTAGLAISVAAPGAAVEANWIALTGNTSGNTTASGSTIAWSGGQGVTLSGTNNSVVGIKVDTYNTTSYNTVSIQTTGYDVASANSVGTVTRWAAEDHRHAGVGAIGISTAGNTSGTTGSKQGTYWLQGGNGIVLSQNTSDNGSNTLVISCANLVRNFEPYRQTNTAGFALGAGSWYFVPFVAPGVISGGRINFLAINTSTAGIARDVTAASFASNTTGTKQQSYTYSLAAALYSMGLGANSTRLESFWSNSFSFGLSGKVQVSVTGGNNSVSVSNSWSISYISDIGSDGAYTLNQYANNGSTGATNTSQDVTALNSIGSSVRNMLSNSLMIPIGFNTTIQEGEYWLGIAWSSTTASAATNFGGTGGASALMFSNLSIVGISNLELNTAYRNWGSTATTARSQIYLGEGAMYTGAANMAPPTNIAISSDLSSIASQWIPYFNVQYRGLTK